MLWKGVDLESRNQGGFLPVLRLLVASYNFLTINMKKCEGTTGDVMFCLTNNREP